MSRIQIRQLWVPFSSLSNLFVQYMQIKWEYGKRQKVSETNFLGGWGCSVIFKECISEAKASLPLPQIYASIHITGRTSVKFDGKKKVHRPVSIQYSDSGNKLLCHQQFQCQ